MHVALGRNSEHSLGAVAEIGCSDRTGTAFHVIVVLGKFAEGLNRVDDTGIIELHRVRDPAVIDFRLLRTKHDILHPVCRGPASSITGPKAYAPWSPTVFDDLITECNQFLPSVSQRDASGATRYLFDDPEMLDWFTSATTSSESYLVPDPQQLPVDVSKMEGLTSDDISEEIRLCVERLKSRGLKVFVLDQSRPDLDVKVAKVIVPNLRHFWRRLGTGRLYDVPVELGLLPEAIDEASVNPRSIFF